MGKVLYVTAASNITLREDTVSAFDASRLYYVTEWQPKLGLMYPPEKSSLQCYE